MNIQSNAMPESPLESQATAPAAMPAPRPLYWSVRRELWENRSIYIAPLAVASVILFGFLISIMHRPTNMRALLADPAHLRASIRMHYNVAAAMIMATAFLVGVFYSLDALYGERRDRSILFWKSLPVSDLTTVLSKACIPLSVLPLVTFVIIVATHTIIALVSSVVWPNSGLTAAMMWAQLPLFKMWVALLYSLIAIALWYAPLYGWLLLVSGWARRSAFLWAVLPPFAVGILEKIAFNTSHFAVFLRYLFIGWFTRAYNPLFMGGAPIDPLQPLTPGKFLSTPGLWIGLLFAAAFLVVAARLRRYREPI
jgi:ABC-2 type transport system permease protein